MLELYQSYVVRQEGFLLFFYKNNRTLIFIAPFAAKRYEQLSEKTTVKFNLKPVFFQEKMTEESILATIRETSTMDKMEQQEGFEIIKGFIVFEGLDGAGTTTQSRLLYENLRRRNTRIVHTCEPTETFIGESIRRVLQEKEKVAPGTLAKLFAADRHNHLYHPQEGILSLVDRGETVICDRYLFSSLAYQSIDWDFSHVWDLNRAFPLPEHLVFLDVSPDEGQRRIYSRNNPREIYERMELQEEIRSNYYHAFTLFEAEPMEVHIFDASLPPDELELSIWKQLKLSDT
ncbi:MAG TPA: dTMP kinase [Sediminispirochaeta sp.]|nr:dTMP kinase [Sediminispirochaeta sp.]